VCRDRAGAVAVHTVSTGTTTTFADLAAECRALEQALIDLGVAPGAVVVSVVGNRPIFFSLVVACMDAGAALVPLGEATDTEVAALVDAAGAAVVVTDRALPLGAVSEHSLVRVCDCSDLSIATILRSTGRWS
jgi:acyl-CoA synthetase (AMP-forming)/AMP-acid ligase II